MFHVCVHALYTYACIVLLILFLSSLDSDETKTNEQSNRTPRGLDFVAAHQRSASRLQLQLQQLSVALGPKESVFFWLALTAVIICFLLVVVPILSVSKYTQWSTGSVVLITNATSGVRTISDAQDSCDIFFAVVHGIYVISPF